jgi:pilus assembly protein CpaB
MSKRAIGLLVAVILALIGTVALVAFVAGAEERALEGEQLVEVYVVTELIAGGTSGDELEELVTVEEVPVKVRPDDAVDSLATLRGRVAAVDLQPGEQLLESRFVEVSEFTSREIGVQVPEDMVEVTVALDPERAVGGLLEPGQTVSVFASFEPFELTTFLVEIDGEEVVIPPAAGQDVEAETPNSTDLILHKVLVTAVQERPAAGSFGAEDGEVDRLTTAPEDQILVTLALPPNDAERVVFTAEFGLVWLAVERETVPDDIDSIKTRVNVYNNDSDGQTIEFQSEETTDEATDETAEDPNASEEGNEP